MKYLLLMPFIFLLACDTETVQNQQVTITNLQEKISQDSLLVVSLHKEMNDINNRVIYI